MCSQKPYQTRAATPAETERTGLKIYVVLIGPNPAAVGSSATLLCTVENLSEEGKFAVVRVRATDTSISVTPGEQKIYLEKSYAIPEARHLRISTEEVEFKVSSNKPGKYPLTVELVYSDLVVDSKSVWIEFRDVVGHELIATPVKHPDLELDEVSIGPNPAAVGSPATLTCIVKHWGDIDRDVIVRVRTVDAGISITPEEQKIRLSSRIGLYATREIVEFKVFSNKPGKYLLTAELVYKGILVDSKSVWIEFSSNIVEVTVEVTSYLLKLPVANAKVSLAPFNSPEYGWIATRIPGKENNYKALVPKGVYYIKVDGVTHGPYAVGSNMVIKVSGLHYSDIMLPLGFCVILGFSILSMNIVVSLGLFSLLGIGTYIMLKLRGSARGGVSDSRVLGVVEKYGGVVVPVVLVRELGVSLEEAQKILEKFVRRGQAVKIRKGPLVIYDFPGVRAFLNKDERRIIELLRDNPDGLSRVDLVREIGLPIESLDETLNRLESEGIVYHDTVSDMYKLKGMSR